MNRLRVKRQEPLPEKKAPLEQAIRRNTAWAAGTEFFQYRDPLYHVTESFQQNFDAMGRRHTITRTGGEEAEGAGQKGRERTNGGREGERGLQKNAEPGQSYSPEGERNDIPDPTSSRSFYEMKNPMDQAMLRRFSETAFQRGTMSGAVLQGTGRMMLFSCLKRTIGQSQPQKEQQRKLFDHASQLRNVPGHNPDQVVFNRGFVNSAVGVVVDTLRDARRTVEDMQFLVRGGLAKTENGMYGADSMRMMYPFLDDSRERELLSSYYEKLRGGGLGADERALMQGAVTKTRALIDKKARMKIEFINKLRFMSDRAAEALTEFEEPGFTAALTRQLEEIFGELPPEDGGDGAGTGGGDGSPDKPEGTGTDEGASPTGDGEPDAGAGGEVPGGDGGASGADGGPT